ncbi:hypothetical protein CHELA40_14851 [Chelatococcus asaccharovorans]|nr:hypothetical protein CHELA40_14851 [Chelatococcus asaccharovorans]
MLGCRRRQHIESRRNRRMALRGEKALRDVGALAAAKLRRRSQRLGRDRLGPQNRLRRWRLEGLWRRLAHDGRRWRRHLSRLGEGLRGSRQPVSILEPHVGRSFKRWTGWTPRLAAAVETRIRAWLAAFDGIGLRRWRITSRRSGDTLGLIVGDDTADGCQDLIHRGLGTARRICIMEFGIR